MYIEAVSPQFGASVHDVDLADLTDTEFDEILHNWWKYGVVLFPNQFLSRDAQLDFSRRFGRLECGLRQSDQPSIGRIANVDNEGNLLPVDSLTRRFNIGNSVWHTDSSYKHVGAKASLLSAQMVPEKGGETEWADMRAGYDQLSDDMRDWLVDKIAVHYYSFSHAWHGGLELLNDEARKDLPPVEHALIKEHPDSKRKILFVGRHASHIVGEDFFESRKLLRRLTVDATKSENTWRHKWQVGDLVIWDNRCVLHRARWTPADQPRAMVRTTVAGDGDHNVWAVN